MRLSFDWLSDYVDLAGITAQEVAEKLTMGAFEVEEVRKFGPDITGQVVIGEILEINPHPNADKIRLTKTRIAPGQEPLEIVCGAQNIEVGQRIPVALPGAKVINRHDGTPLEIKVSAIRGVQSNGMLCSPPELGIVAESKDGILILDQSHGEIGSDIKKLFHLYQDDVLIVEPRSNRGDALSVIGLAREVAALLKRPLKRPAWSVEAKVSEQLDFRITLENPDDCPFFTIRRIEGLKVGPSPTAIARRLEAVGLRTINNVVDITNYVMQEYGQPLHAYDMSKLRQNELTVRRARADERLTTLDSKERTLTDEVLVIANAGLAVGVAGVMGGLDSEISDSTVSIALEAASFNQARVRRGSRLLGLSSDSSLRFERGVDVGSTAEASDRATYLLLEHCTEGGSAQIGPLAKAGNDKTTAVSVNLRLPQLKRILDAEFSSEQVREFLTPLGFSVQTGSPSEVSVSIPSFRQSDVTREIDLVEEVCRIWGYDNLPVRMPRSGVTAEPPDNTLTETRSTLVAQGLSEAWLSSLTAQDTNSEMERYSTQNAEKIVRVLNPLSEDHQVMRQSLLPGLIKATAYNQDRGRKDVWLFEIGRTYTRLSGSENDEFGTGVKEDLLVAGILMGERQLSGWQERGLNADFYATKGVVENLISSLGIDLKRVRFFAGETVKILHPSRSCQIQFDPGPAKTGDNNNNQKGHHHSQNIGIMGQLHPGLSDAMGLKQPAFLFELKMDVLTRLRAEKSFQELLNTPAVIRDLTVDVEEKFDHAVVESCISSSAGDILKDLDLVSIYQPAEGKRSLSYRLSFQDAQRTLTADEVTASLSKIRQSLTARLQASFRD